MRYNLSTTPDLRFLCGPIGRSLEPFPQRFGLADEDLVTGSWVPPVYVIENAERVLLVAELPGIRRNDIEINFADGRLTLRGERPFQNESETHRYHRIERRYGSFARSFALPRTVDPERISASFVEGILEVSVPKRDEAKPRQIRIDVT